MAQAVLFDTHAFIKELKESGFEERQAEALSSAIKRVQEAHLEALASKQDILLLQRDIKELELRLEGKIDLLKWMMGFILAGVLSLVLKAFFIF